MSKFHKNRRWIRYLPIAAIVVMTVFTGLMMCASDEAFSVETVLHYTPDNVMLVAFVLILCFALKSFTIVFPLSVLYLASGIMFSPVPAVLISTAGLFITISIPYWIGRLSGKEVINRLQDRYEKMNKIVKYQGCNVFLICFITRIVGFLPGDILSMYFGACKVPYGKYAIAGVCGSLLSIITTTLLGTKLRNPFSIEFVIVLILRILVTVLSVVLSTILKRKR